MIYQKEQLNEISFPLGGIGTGSIGLNGYGCLVDWEIFNRPNKGSINQYTFFALRAEFPDGKTVSKVLQGDWTKDLSGTYSNPTGHSGFGYGPDGGTLAGLPHFEKTKFDGAFPIATLTFEDESFPAKVILKAFNPFIPLNAEDSGIPAAFFEIEIKSKVEGVKYTVAMAAKNPFEIGSNHVTSNKKYTAVTLKHAGLIPDERDYGELTLALDRPDGRCQEYWYRGGWQDGISAFWYDFTTGDLIPRHYEEPGEKDHCTLAAEAVIDAKRSEKFRFILSWNCPNCYNYWKPYTDEEGKDILWKNYYATRFKTSAASAFYGLKHWRRLYRETEQFRKAMHGSTLDPAAIDAATASLEVLKSPTVLRLEDGTFYGWEGVSERKGSCEGTCTHVWSYAYALCYLFPELERSLRDTEFRYDTEGSGLMRFRTHLPLGRGKSAFHPCLDGQMATVIKIYRDWKLTGNSQWLKENWENVKLILEFAWSPENAYEWDRDKDGVLEGRQHHTLDMELFGPSGWLQGLYCAALKAAAEMAEFLGEPEKTQEYTNLFEKGYTFTKENLFNGEYFIQKVDLSNKGYTEHFNVPEYWNAEREQLKYQIAEGCEIDQLLGQWHANLCGLGDIFDAEQRKVALRNMMNYNFKPKMREVANLWRVFALNDEAGAIMCDYPEGRQKPVIPIPYCEECMTGFEYAFAGLLIQEGFLEEGLRVVKAIRDRYDGKKRNPWNEIECGSNYARVMAAFALFPIFSGLTFDLPRKTIGFAPVTEGPFKSFFGVGTGWGTFERDGAEQRILLQKGFLNLAKVMLKGEVTAVYADGKEIPFEQREDGILFEEQTIAKELVFKMK